jgi:hypothetical protein
MTEEMQNVNPVTEEVAEENVANEEKEKNLSEIEKRNEEFTKEVNSILSDGKPATITYEVGINGVNKFIQKYINENGDEEEATTMADIIKSQASIDMIRLQQLLMRAIQMNHKDEEVESLQDATITVKDLSLTVQSYKNFRYFLNGITLSYISDLLNALRADGRFADDITDSTLENFIKETFNN